MAGCSYLKSVAAVFFAAICAYLAAWLFPSLSQTPKAAPVTAAAETVIRLEGIALRQERALELPRKGVFLPESSERIPAGALVYEGFICDNTAIFIENCDGLEYLSPPEGEKLSLAQLEDYLNSKPVDRPGEGRLVEGFYWYYAAFLPPDAPELACGTYYLKFEGFEEYTRALLVSCERENAGTALLFRLRLGDPAYLHLRKCEAELLVSGFIT